MDRMDQQRSVDAFWGGYQQTQSDMFWAYNQGYFQPEQPTVGQTVSSLLNATPWIGAGKMWIESGFTGKDLITGQWVNRSDWETFFGVTANALSGLGMMSGMMSEAALNAQFSESYVNWQVRNVVSWGSRSGEWWNPTRLAAETTVARQTTILGENMAQRVMPFAEQTGARTLGFGATKEEWAAMTPAERWKLNDGMLRARINEGDLFRYIGQDPLRNPVERAQFDLTRSELLRLDSRNVPYEIVTRPQVELVIQRP